MHNLNSYKKQNITLHQLGHHCDNLLAQESDNEVLISIDTAYQEKPTTKS